jgi:hypothetical protein
MAAALPDASSVQSRPRSQFEKSSADTREAHFRGIEIENGAVRANPGEAIDRDESDDANTMSDSERKRKTNSIAANRGRREKKVRTFWEYYRKCDCTVRSCIRRKIAIESIAAISIPSLLAISSAFDFVRRVRLKV